ncbi:MAG TPA: hypothetical protein VE974_16900 [Thermoanaerobaculia bacterium]|nr:hypothetical protein [Thermoanaerobaculia bacterium]
MAIRNTFIALLFVSVTATAFAQTAGWTENAGNTTTLNNVGVGTTAPGAKLDVNAPNALGIRTSGWAVASAGWYSPDLSSGINGWNGNLWLRSGGIDARFILNTSGQLGLGINPAAGNLMHINGITRGEDRFEVRKGGSDSIAAGSGFFLGDPVGDWVGMQMSAAKGLDFWTQNNGWSRRMTITTDGNVGIGTVTPTQRLDVNGNINVSGNINAKYQDLAEWVEATSQLAPGTVVILDPARNDGVTASATAYDTSAAGVVSAQPGISLGERSESKVQVATTGRVRVKVDTSSGAIRIGDLLVTSDTPGRAMRSAPVDVAGIPMHRPGTMIGKALEPLEKGQGEILVLLTLQ